ncbi:hypothetical protein [Desulfovibrio sp. QI0442]
MKLYQRVKKIAQDLAGSEVKLGTAMKMNPRTLNGYLKESREHNLWPLLPTILKIFPQVSREWLYFDEGEMLKADCEKALKPIRSAADQADQNIGAVPALEKENAALRELVDSKNEVIALQKQLLAKVADQADQDQRGMEFSGGPPAHTASAPGTPSAAHLLRRSTDREGGKL